jgi:hypothetical protein
MRENGVREGKGIHSLKNGNIFEGEWKNSVMYIGKVIKIGSRYEGELTNFKKEGKGDILFKWKEDL